MISKQEVILSLTEMLWKSRDSKGEASLQDRVDFLDAWVAETQDPRPSWDSFFLNQLPLMSMRANCWRRRASAILVDSNNHILSTGYNGPPAQTINCLESKCKGSDQPSGFGLNACHASHAETNALFYVSDKTKIATAYILTSPCIECVKDLSLTSCQRIVFLTPYPHHDESREYWEGRMGRKWEHKTTQLAQVLNELVGNLHYPYRSY